MDMKKKLPQLSDAFFDRLNTLIEIESSRGLFYLIVIFFIVALLWGALAMLDEVTVGLGKIVPSSQIQIIQNLEGGILTELSVHEGEVVKKDQVLVRLSDTKSTANYKEGRKRYLAFLASNARLFAQSNGHDKVAFPPEVLDEASDSVKIETKLFQSQMKSFDESISYLSKSYRLGNEELQKTKPLLAKGAASEVEIIRLERQVNDLKGQIEDKKNKFKADAQSEHNKNQLEIQGLEQSNIYSADQLTRTTIKSPVNGAVKKLHVVTLGGVIQPGMTIMEIVPIEDNLLIEARVKPNDIAFLKIGQEATVKVSAYDFSTYGGIKGILEQISADTMIDEKSGESYFLIKVRTDKNYIVRDEKHLPIIPGMTAEVDVLTGRKSVLSYLMKPLLKTKQNALRER
ncbi:AcrA Membrane-fusion protein [Candidatus Methylopumilus universalis]|uniref:HlyD family type I secretion periplasmic adaptor subunit n=1 Tax=Candidatus Methylopumilus universalis TaxID=2588536 RepID=UPI003BEF1652